MNQKKETANTGSLNNIEDRSLNQYLKEISKTTPLTSKEEAELTIRIRDGDQNALNKLVKANLRFVVSVAKAYQHQGLPLVDLINEGNLGLIEAARRFDERKNFRFISYAVWWIRQAILQLLAVNSRTIRLPINRVAFLHKIGITERKLEQRLQRTPTTEEIADELDTCEQDVLKMTIVGGKHLSLDSGTNDDMTTFHDIISSVQENDVESRLINADLNKEIDKVLSNLDSREKDIVKLNFGIGYSTTHTLSEIGVKYNITRERVRQIRLNALVKLQKTRLHGNLLTFL
jgi:RNA polymerase primary sigma factor